MRAEVLALARKSPHPAVPATFSWEKERRPRRVCNSKVKRAKTRDRLEDRLGSLGPQGQELFRRRSVHPPRLSQGILDPLSDLAGDLSMIERRGEGRHPRVAPRTLPRQRAATPSRNYRAS
jgi:hypothetical protein